MEIMNTGTTIKSKRLDYTHTTNINEGNQKMIINLFSYRLLIINYDYWNTCKKNI